MDGLQISEVADRTGFAPPTLRYYERIGLLPSPERSESGYRLFSEQDVDLLDFIARAKRLGLPLEEIKTLAEAWSRDDCKATQEQLITLLDAKLAQVRHLIGDLVEFRDQLDEVFRELSRRQSPKRCGPECGCDIEVSKIDLDASREITLVSLKPHLEEARRST
jgi:MerR family copper efflux transcriptional regulator